MKTSLSTFLMMGLLPPAPGSHRLGWALVDETADGDLVVQTRSVRGIPEPAMGFGDDYGDDAGDDTGDEDDDDADDFGDDAGDDAGDDTGDFGDDAGDDTGGLSRKQRKLIANHQAAINRIQGRGNRRGTRRGRKMGTMTDKTVTGVGTVAGSVGAAMTMTITPKSSFWLKRIASSGDTAAVLTTVFAGEIPILIDPVDCSLIAATAFHQPTFHGKRIRAGVPVSVNYTAGSTTVALRLTFSGRGKAQSC